MLNFKPLMLRFWIEALLTTGFGFGFFGADGGWFDYEAPKLPPLANGWFGRVILVKFVV